MSYTAEERETCIICSDADKTWHLYTLMTSVIGKLRRLGIEPVKVDKDGGHYYQLNFNQVSFRSGKRKEISEEQRQKRAERMAEMHRRGKLGKMKK